MDLVTLKNLEDTEPNTFSSQEEISSKYIGKCFHLHYGVAAAYMYDELYIQNIQDMLSITNTGMYKIYIISIRTAKLLYP